MSTEDKETRLNKSGYFERTFGDHAENPYEWFDPNGNRIATAPKRELAIDFAYSYVHYRDDFIDEDEKEAKG